jgi:hypothetical protein
MRACQMHERREERKKCEEKNKKINERRSTH